jgi:hypothetical protein
MSKSVRTHVLLLTILLFPAFSVAAFAGPTISSVSPNAAYNWGGVLISVEGTGFADGAVVTLSMEGQPDIKTPTVLESSTIIKGRIDLMGEQPGTYDVVVTNPDNQSASLTAGFTLNAQPAPSVTSSTPGLTDNMGLVKVELTGDGFLPGARVSLTRDGQADIDAISVMVESADKIICEFNLTGVQLGSYNIKVINPDGQSNI